MTETFVTPSNPYQGERNPGTIGLPLPGVSIRLGERDEIEVRGPAVFAAYWGHAVAAVDAFRDGGWFRIGSIDEDAYVRIGGRTKELIISGGHNVNPREVEETLGAHPKIIEVAVVGVPGEAWAGAVTA